jgi:hypothetical protein
MVVRSVARVDRPTAVVVWISIAVVVADLLVYVVLIKSQGGTAPDAFTVPFVAGYLALMAVVLRLSLANSQGLATLRPALRAAAAAGLLLLGIFAALSIGIPIFLAGILAFVAAIRALIGRNVRSAIISEIAAGVIAVLVLVGGFELTQRIILCPPSGNVGGSSSGFVTGAFHYQCVNGTLTMYSGDCNGVTGGVDAGGNPIASNGC